jgi:hypothetical protein
MSHAIRLELRNYRLTREKSLRDLLDRLAPGATEGWLTYNLHGGGTASASVVFVTDAPDPRALVARLLAALVAADDNAKPFIESIVPVAGLGARVG